MNLSFFDYVLAMTGSFMAGAINTLAGNGSVITLSILTDLVGLPGNIANGTNRVGVFLQSAASSRGFAKNKMLDITKSRHIIILTIIGAIMGVYTATIVSNAQFLTVFKYLLIVMLLVVLINPERWLIEAGIKKKNYHTGFLFPLFSCLDFMVVSFKWEWVFFFLLYLYFCPNIVLWKPML